MARRFGIRLLIVLLLVAFGVFYGVDLATRGMEQVHGPLPGAEEVITEEEFVNETDDNDTTNVDSSSANRDTEQTIQAAQSQSQSPVYTPRSPNITEMIGNGLQKVAQGVVDTVVTVFELFL